MADPSARDILLEGARIRRSVHPTGRPAGLRTFAQRSELVAMAGSAGPRAVPAARPAPDPPRPGRTRGTGTAARVPGRRRSLDPLRGDPVGRRASTGGVSPDNCWRGSARRGDPRDLPGHTGGARDAGPPAARLARRAGRRGLHRRAAQGRSAPRRRPAPRPADAPSRPPRADARPARAVPGLGRRGDANRGGAQPRPGTPCSALRDAGRDRVGSDRPGAPCEPRRSPAWPKMQTTSATGSWPSPTDGPAVLRREALRSLRGTSLSPENLGRLRDANRDDARRSQVDRSHECRGCRRRNRRPEAEHADGRRLAGPTGGAGRPVGRGAGLLPFQGAGLLSLPPGQRPGRPRGSGPVDPGVRDRPPPAGRVDRRARAGRSPPSSSPGAWPGPTGPSSRASCSSSRPTVRWSSPTREGRRIVVKSDEIAERKPQTTSIMPDDLATHHDHPGVSRPHRLPGPRTVVNSMSDRHPQ